MLRASKCDGGLASVWRACCSSMPVEVVLLTSLRAFRVSQVFWTFFSVMGGGVYFNEFKSLRPMGALGFSVGVLVVRTKFYLSAALFLVLTMCFSMHQGMSIRELCPSRIVTSTFFGWVAQTCIIFLDWRKFAIRFSPTRRVFLHAWITMLA